MPAPYPDQYGTIDTNFGQVDTQSVPRFLRPLSRTLRSVDEAIPDFLSGLGGALKYPFESVPLDESDIPEAPMSAPPAPAVTPTRVPVDDPGIPMFSGQEEPEDVAQRYITGGMPDFTRGGGLTREPEPRRGQVSINIGGKSYDYGADERIPLLHRGGYGEGNLAANQPGGVIPGREPEQISPVGMAEEARRGGTGVSMMQADEVLPSQLEGAANRAAMAELERKASDPYGIEQYRQRAEIEREIRSADEHAKGEETRRTQDAMRQGFTSEMNTAFRQHQAEMERLEAAKERITPEQYKTAKALLQERLEFDKQTIGGKYGVKMPNPLAALGG